MRELEQRAAVIGLMEQRRKIGKIARELSDQNFQAEILDDAVAVTGRGLVKRWLSEASLRFITGLTQ
jgi:hypothetical protein